MSTTQNEMTVLVFVW